MTGTILLLAVGAAILAVIVVSVMRKRKGTLTVLMESTVLSSYEPAKGNIQIALNQASETEELSVTLKCVETIKYHLNGEEKSETKTVYEDTTTLISACNHEAGHNEQIPFELSIPSRLETSDLGEFYRSIHAADEPDTDRFNEINAATGFHRSTNSYQQPSGYRQHNGYQTQNGYHPQPHTRYQQPYGHQNQTGYPLTGTKTPSDFPTSELRWQISAHLKSSGIDLHDNKSLNIHIANPLDAQGAYQY